jgi:hypothetical protein
VEHETPYHEDSLQYRDSRQLIEPGFMKSSPGLEAFLAEKKGNKTGDKESCE